MNNNEPQSPVPTPANASLTPSPILTLTPSPDRSDDEGSEHGASHPITVTTHREMRPPNERTALVQHSDDDETDSELVLIEKTWRRFLRWSFFEIAIRNTVLLPIISQKSLRPADASATTSTCISPRVPFSGRAVLIQNPQTHMAAQAAIGAVDGVEKALFVSMHLALWTVLGYRLIMPFVEGESVNLESIWESLITNEEIGANSIMHLFAKAPPEVLETLPALLPITGLFYALQEAYAARAKNPEQIEKIISHFEHFKPNFFMNHFGFLFAIRHIPPLSLLPPLHCEAAFREIENLLLWNGASVTDAQRRRMIRILTRFATDGHLLTQSEAMHTLGNIAQGIGLNTLSTLKKAGLAPEALQMQETLKAMALQCIRELAADYPAQRATSLFGRYIKPIPRYAYAQYLLWWLGRRNELLGKHLSPLTGAGFWLFKIAKIGIEIKLIQVLISSGIEAFECPDKKGFVFGKGATIWANKLDLPCFQALVDLFRSLPGAEHEPVENLIGNIEQFDLRGFTTLNLENKHLNAYDAGRIIQAIATQPDVNDALTQVRLGGNDFGRTKSDPEGISFLCEQLSAVSGLRALYLNSTGLERHSTRDGVALGDGLKRLTGLELLDLSDNALDALGSEGTRKIGESFANLNQLEQLNLSRNKLDSLGSNGTQAIGKNLPDSLRYLDLSRNALEATDSDGVIALSQSFQRTTELETLILSDNKIGELSAQGTEAFGMALKYLINLQFLDLSNNKIGAFGARGTQAIGASLSQLTQLKQFIMQSNPIGLLDATGTTALAQGLPASLEVLDLTDTHLGYTESTSVNNLASKIKELTHLIRLHLNSNYLEFTDSKGMVALAESICTLETLQLLGLYNTYLGFIDNSGTKVFADCLSNLSNLQELYLNGNKIGSTGMQIWDALGSMAAALHQKTRINLSENLLNSTGARLFLSHMNNTLPDFNTWNILPSNPSSELFSYLLMQIPSDTMQLKINSQVLDAEKINILSAQLKRFSQLKVLDISENDMDRSQPNAIANLMKVIGTLGELEYLNLFFNRLDKYNSIASCALGEALTQCRKLKTLIYTGNFLGNTDKRGVAAISKAVTAMNLEKLDLSSNNIGSDNAEGIKALSDGLASCTTLLSLSLSGNDFGATNSENAIMLIQGIMQHTGLESLGLGFNKLGIFDSKSIGFLGDHIHRLSALKVLGLSGNYIGLTDPLGTVKLAQGAQTLTQLQEFYLAGNYLGFKGDAGVNALAEMASHLPHTMIDLTGKAENTSLALCNLMAALRERSLIGICTDKLCHANNPQRVDSDFSIDAIPSSASRRFEPPFIYHYITQAVALPKMLLQEAQRWIAPSTQQNVEITPQTARTLFANQHNPIHSNEQSVWEEAQNSALQTAAYAAFIATAHGYLHAKGYSEREIRTATLLMGLCWLSYHDLSLLPAVATNTLVAFAASFGMTPSNTTLVHCIASLALSVWAHAPDFPWEMAQLMAVLLASALTTKLAQTVQSTVAPIAQSCFGFFNTSQAQGKIRHEPSKLLMEQVAASTNSEPGSARMQFFH